MNALRHHPLWACAALSAVCALQPARADAVTDWNLLAADILAEARLGPAPAHRAMAIVHTAVYDAVNAVTRRYPSAGPSRAAPDGTSVDVAVAAASRTTLLKLAPSQRMAIDAAYEAALAKVANAEARSNGVAVGEGAAAAVLAARADDGIAAQESYRPHAAPGAYVPTAMPVATTWPQRKPWLMKSCDQFRPGPPPALSSAVWARDYNEIKAYGGKTSSVRSAEQTAIATFWEATLPPIYAGIVRSVANAPGREVTRNARLFAAVTQAMDDALMAVFDAKYTYNFWRPVTAIRNGDADGNDATERDASWTSFIDSPLHPEYPCAHCTLAGAVGAVLAADIGGAPVPTLTTTSSFAKGTTRSWTRVEAFVQEVSDARVYDGVHFRNSAQVGSALGRQVGELAATRILRAAD